VPGVYGGLLDKIPIGAAFAKGLRLTMGQTHVHRYIRPIMERMQAESFDPAIIVSHRGRLEDAPRLYRIFRDKEDRCTKVILQP
jgi:threonine dehydrogenase-like Zn-dependent dehydrogenase